MQVNEDETEVKEYNLEEIELRKPEEKRREFKKMSPVNQIQIQRRRKTLKKSNNPCVIEKNGYNKIC